MVIAARDMELVLQAKPVVSRRRDTSVGHLLGGVV